MKFRYVLYLLMAFVPLIGFSQNQRNSSFSYKVEAITILSDEGVCPLWLTANRYGIYDVNKNQIVLRTGLLYQKELKRNWQISSGLEIVGGSNLISNIHVHQAYIDISWKKFTLYFGAKEQMGAPLQKNYLLSSGYMVEGPNVRPIPQIRGEIKDYLPVPGTNSWLSFKGHLAYGYMFDGNWQENFVGTEQEFTKNVLYHSKSLMVKIGNKETFPFEFESGIITAAQFGGKKFVKHADGSIELLSNMPNSFKDFFKILIPKQQNTLANVTGNHCGSWNFALNAHITNWQFRTYYEHYFEDHSQLFWQYGSWKDGLIGMEINFPSNRWISTILWEGMSTKDQTGPVLYDGVGGSFGDLQMSGNDHYYNNYEFLGWQYYGSSLGHPFLYGPMYNSDASNSIKSSRIRSNHMGLSGQPSVEWNWRLLASFVRHWGTYRLPLDRQRKQFSGMFEINYHPQRAKGWSMSATIGFDKGNYLGNHIGGMLSIKKVGGFVL